MLFTIDMGNSNIVLGCMDGDRLVFEERLSTDRQKTEIEYSVTFKNVFELYGVGREKITGCILSSVVPPLTNVLKTAVYKLFGIDVMVVGPGIKTGLNILIDNPAQLGSDLVVDAVAGLAEYKPPMAIIDMGTATTICVIDRKSRYLGGMIIPGVKASLDSLVANTSQLPRISMEAPKKVIGSNTVDCMRSGLLYGNAACIDGMIDRVETELGETLTVIATGGLASSIVPLCKRDIILDPTLLIKGLKLIYDKNK